MDETQPDINFFNAKPSNSSYLGDEKTKNNGKPHKKAPKFVPSDLYFDMSGEKFLMIFNHFEYQKTIYFNDESPSTRNGTDEDVLTLKRTFGDLGFKVITYTNLEHSQILEKVWDVSNQDHTNTSCLIIVILTHGDKGGKLFAADKPYLLRDLTTQLENGHIGLVTTPKLFFIQAGLMDDGKTVQYDGEPRHSMLVPTHIDYLIMQSSVKGEGDDSWLIQELCENIQNYHHDMDILHLITLTTRNVAFKLLSMTENTETNDKKQTLETRCTLTKFLKF